MDGWDGNLRRKHLFYEHRFAVLKTPSFHLFQNGQMSGSGRLQSCRSTFAKYGNTTQMEIGRFDRNLN